MLMTNELRHYGIKGMHWGIRRYQPYPKGTKARKAQKSIEKVLRKSKDTGTAHKKFNKNPYIQEAAKQLHGVSQELKEARFDCETQMITDSTKIMKNLWLTDKNGKKRLNMNHKVVKDFLNDIDAVDDKEATKRELQSSEKAADRIAWDIFADQYVMDHKKEFPEYEKSLNNMHSIIAKRDALSKDLTEKLVGDMGNVKLASVFKDPHSLDNVKELV